jgi:hypothetical protein
VYSYSFCLWIEKTNSLPFGNISLFNKFHSIDGFPGLANSKLIDIAINNKSKSYPLTKPFDSLAVNVEPIISIIKSIADILVSIPKSRANPIISNDAIITGICGGNPIVCEKKCCVPEIFTSLDIPWAINMIPAKMGEDHISLIFLEKPFISPLPPIIGSIYDFFDDMRMLEFLVIMLIER